MLIFWTFAFPIILGAFFYLAFSDIEDSEKLSVIDIAIVENENFTQNPIWSESFKTLGDEADEERLFNIQYVSREQAAELLEDGDISGYVEISDSGEPNITVKASGVSETVLKYVTEEIMMNANLAGMYVQGSGATASDAIAAESGMMSSEVRAAIKDISGGNLSYTMIEFYTLIAMTCLYGGIIGMTAVNRGLANISVHGRRVAISPTKKRTIVLSSVLAGYIIQLIGMALLFLYTVFVLKVDYGDKLHLIVLLALCGCFAGLTMGIAIAVLVKSNENLKTGIIISISMAGSFFSGMMGMTMKYVIDSNVPVINKINPVAMITDGLYSLYYYDTYDRYIFDAASLVLFSAVMIGLSISGLRRQRYDSI